MTASAGPRLPRTLMAGGSSVAVVDRPIRAGSLAHRSLSQKRVSKTTRYRGKGVQESYEITACAVQLPEPDRVDAYLVTAAWADHLGAVACTEPACFPTA